MLIGKNRKGRPSFTMQAISHTVLPEESGCTVRHILKAILHFSPIPWPVSPGWRAVFW